jgi:translation initiation factor IF-2
MGHIDHGKSTLLDYIRKTNVAGGEVGGITQRLSAYEATHKGESGETKKITFLDTPGHEAFQKMRFHSASAADIAILIISAEDGVKAQTLEAYKAIQENKIPYIVAINKIDKPNANIERAKQTLVENEIYIEGYGGDVPCAEISSKTGKGIPELLDMVLLMADMEELTGDTNAPAEGVVIESHMDPKTGASATLLIKNGTLKKGMCLTAGKALTPVRWINDFLGKKIETAQFSMPVYISGWSELPETGSQFLAHANKKEGECCVKEFTEENCSVRKASSGEEAEGTIIVPVIIRADALGAIDAIRHEIEKINNVLGIRVKILASGGGNITENDIKMAYSGNNALVIGFGSIKIDASAKDMADRFNITIATFDIIYKLSEWLAEELEKRRPRVVTEEKKGEAKIIRFFSGTKNSQIVGGKVKEGYIALGDNIRILRRDFEIGRGRVVELQQQKLKSKQVGEGYEFGAKIESKCEIAPGDMIEAYDTVSK